MSKIGISFWGLCADFESHRFITTDTPDGHRYGRSLLINELLSRGHEVVALQQCRDEVMYPGLKYSSSEFPELDVVFFEWRWPTYKNYRMHPQHDSKKFEPDLERQQSLLEVYHGDIPTLLWDTDLKITPKDEKMWSKSIIADPSFETNKLTRKRESLPFWSDFKQHISVSNPYSVYGYIGNNYERDDEFSKFYFSVSNNLRRHGIQTSMYGNWLQASPERKPPQTLIKTNELVSFNHRMNFYDSMQMMNKFICTTHVSKPRYYETGFMSPRYLEALAVNCPALVPKEFKVENILGQDWTVSGPHDVIENVKLISRLSFEERTELVEEQRESIKRLKRFDVGHTADFIESLI